MGKEDSGQVWPPEPNIDQGAFYEVFEGTRSDGRPIEHKETPPHVFGKEQ